MFGLWDWFGIPERTRAKTIGLWHGIANLAVIAIFVVSGLLRLDEPSHIPSVIAYTLEMFGAGTAVISGWLGGELVERLGVGVHEGGQRERS